MEERRATPRYNLALPVEIRLTPTPIAEEFLTVETRDISTQGFYVDIAQEFAVGTKFEFSIALRSEVIGATQAYVSGMARVVRVEEGGGSVPGGSGVGALIENYQIRRGRS